MDLNFETPGDHHFIRSFGADGARIGEQLHKGSLLVSSDKVLKWPPSEVAELEDEHIDAVLALEPEIVIIGTGPQQVFLPPLTMMKFYERGVGVEVMTSEAACRTFNILVSDGRNAVVALMPLGQ